MDNEKIKTYSYRVSQANKTELIVIMYDIAVDYINDSLNDKSVEEYRDNLKRAKRVIDQLQRDLNMEYEISKQLYRIYSVMQRYLICALAERNDDKNKLLKSVIKMLNDLRKAFYEISKEDTSHPVMQNAQQVYAGLTYSSQGGSNEVYENSNVNRGYRI